MKMIPESSFQSHLYWNFGSLFFIGIGGFFLNVLIARVYGAEALGVFNQVLAYYLIVSQTSVGGIAFSTLRFVSRYARRNDIYTDITSTSLALVFVLSSIAALFSWWVAPTFAEILDSPNVETGIKCVTPGLVFFSLNKVLFSALNGSRQMRAYAIGQSSRYILSLIVLIFLILNGYPIEFLPVLFTISELILFIGLISYSLFSTGSIRIKANSPWWKRHLVYGCKAWLTGLLMDLNTKVDILMLGYFVDDRTVGIYAFSLLFVEAIMQLITVVQNSYNPLLAKLDFQERKRELRKMIKNVYLYFSPFLFINVIAIILIFPWLTDLVTDDAEFQGAIVYFVIISLCVVLVSGILPFNMVINQFGKPSLFTFFIITIVLINFLLNIILIPIMGASGAALATGCAFLCQAPLLRIFLSRII